MPGKIAVTIAFRQLRLRNAREVIVDQLELLGRMIREQSGIAPVEVTVRADVVDLMARILVAVFQAKEKGLMTELLYSPKIKPEHLARKAIVYLRQSSEKTYCKNLGGGTLADSDTLGVIVVKIRAAGAGHQLFPLCEDLEDLNEYTKRYHHGENAQPATESATDLENAIPAGHGESWWQTYVKSKILIIQQGYIKAMEKMNIAIGTTKFPDFSLVTHDNYLDILEIKKPSTDILKLDSSRGNHYFDSEISKAIVQVENYIATVTAHGDAVRSYILDNHKMDLKVVRPRGIILAGNASQFTEQKQKDDFRLLSQGLKNLTIVTYDELLTRLKNYIEVLEEFSKKLPAEPDARSGRKKKEAATETHDTVEIAR
jgi:Domain of unknown function (DUF4263)